MSSNSQPHEASGGFHPHVSPLRDYLGVFAALLVLTVITVAAAQVDLGGTVNMVLAMAIATVKATLVALIFMHLLYDNKLYLIVFVSALLFLGIFIIETMFDTMRRDDLGVNKGKPIESTAAAIPAYAPDKPWLQKDAGGHGHGAADDGHDSPASHQDGAGATHNSPTGHAETTDTHEATTTDDGDQH